MVATVAAGTTAAYYTSLADYYSGANEPPGRWSRVGFEAGVTVGQQVDSAIFARLHAALDERRRTLLANDGGKLERVGGYDVTFSAPKSVSVAWGLADTVLRRQIEQAQVRATDAALKMLEKNAAFCRSGKAGRLREPVRLTVAAFQHGGARPETHADGTIFSDPNLHTHAVVLNLGRKADGRFGALDGKGFFNWKMAAGATYHASLANSLADIGFGIVEIGKNGTFEVAGIPDALKAYFSARRHRIEEELAAGDKLSAEAPALAAAVARATRKEKQVLEGKERDHLWRERAESLGFSHELVGQALRQPAPDLTPADAERLAANRIDGVLRQLTEHQSVFGRRQLHAALAASLVGSGVGPEHVSSEISALLSTGRVAMLDKDAWGHEVMTTPEILAIEREIGAIALALQDGPRPTLLPLPEKRIAEAKLSSEQTAAVRSALDAQAITIIEGAPGSGKSTTLRPIKEAYEAAGYRVLGTATAWRIAHMLRDDLGIEARATDAWLAGAGHGHNFLDAKSVLIVDEAGLLSSRQMHRLLQSVEVARDEQGRAPRLILVGDRNQLQSVGAGSGLGLVAAALPVDRVEAIQRQRELWARDAILAFGKGEATTALHAFAERGRLHELDGATAAIRALVDAYEAVEGTGGSDTLLIAKTNVQVRAIAQEVRRRLRERKLLVGTDVAIKAVTRSGHGTDLPLAAGDRVTFLARATIGDHEVINGTQARITRIVSRGGGDIRIEALVGAKRLSFSPQDIADEHGRARLAHAYATTVHGAQGLTSERSFVLLTPEMDRHDAYVAASRSRGETHFFVDQKALEASARAELPLNLRAAHIIDAAAAREHLAARLARSGVKLTTVDVLTAAREREAALDVAERVQPADRPPTDRPSRKPRRGLALD